MVTPSPVILPGVNFNDGLEVADKRGSVFVRIKIFKETSENYSCLICLTGRKEEMSTKPVIASAINIINAIW